MFSENIQQILYKMGYHYIHFYLFQNKEYKSHCFGISELCYIDINYEINDNNEEYFEVIIKTHLKNPIILETFTREEVAKFIEENAINLFHKIRITK